MHWSRRAVVGSFVLFLGLIGTLPAWAAPPAAPASMSVQPAYCFGWASLSWSSSTGATFYQVEQSPYPNLSYASTVYSGPDTFRFHNAGTGTNYFRVRACNSDGCSGYAYGDSPVTYQDPCW